MRRVVGVLLAINALMAIWFVLRPSVMREVSGVEGKLVLVSEAQALQVRADAACLFVGPVSEDRLVRDLENLHDGWQEVVRSVPGEIRHRVYVTENELPATPEDGAGIGLLAAVRTGLQDAALEDVESYQMVGGEFDGAVSFGLFAEQNNAQRLLERLQGNGIPALIVEEALYEEVVWLAELASNVPARALSAMENLLLTRPEMNIEENLCEMFALRE